MVHVCVVFITRLPLLTADRAYKYEIARLVYMCKLRGEGSGTYRSAPVPRTAAGDVNASCLLWLKVPATPLVHGRCCGAVQRAKHRGH